MLGCFYPYVLLQYYKLYFFYKSVKIFYHELFLLKESGTTSPSIYLRLYDIDQTERMEVIPIGLGDRLIVVVRQGDDILAVDKIFEIYQLPFLKHIRLFTWIYSAHCFVPIDLWPVFEENAIACTIIFQRWNVI